MSFRRPRIVKPLCCCALLGCAGYLASAHAQPETPGDGTPTAIHASDPQDAGTTAVPSAPASEQDGASLPGTGGGTAVAPDAGQAEGPGTPAGTTSVEPDNREKAVELLLAGNERMLAREFEAALDSYQRAYAIYPSVKLLLNIGTSLRHLGRHAEAADAYERYLGSPEADPARSQELTRLLADIDRQVAAIRVVANDPSVRILVDARPLSSYATPGRVRLDPGQHHVVFEGPGGERTTQTLTLRAGEERTVRRAPPTSAAPASPEYDAAVYGLASVAAVALAMGAAFGVLAITSVLEQGDEPEPTLEKATSEYANYAYAGLAIGGASLVATLVVSAVAPDEGAPGDQGVSKPRGGPLPAVGLLHATLRW